MRFLFCTVPCSCACLRLSIIVVSYFLRLKFFCSTYYKYDCRLRLPSLSRSPVSFSRCCSVLQLHFLFYFFYSDSTPVSVSFSRLLFSPASPVYCWIFPACLFSYGQPLHTWSAVIDEICRSDRIKLSRATRTRAELKALLSVREDLFVRWENCRPRLFLRVRAHVFANAAVNEIPIVT